MLYSSAWEDLSKLQCLAPGLLRARGMRRNSGAVWASICLLIIGACKACQEVESLVSAVQDGNASESDVQRLLACQPDCQVLIELGCNQASQTFPALQHAATSLTCSNPENLTQSSLELWLSCGGDIGWEDAAGNPLFDLLRNKEARKFWQQQANLEAAVASVVTDWRAWVVPISVVLAAFLEVCSERWWLRKHRQGQGSTEAQQDPFLDGAKLLVSKSFRKHNIMVSLWRFLEVSTCIFWFALVLLIMHWAWWLPGSSIWYLSYRTHCRIRSMMMDL